MSKIIIHQHKIKNIEETLKICPFGAIEYTQNKLDITSACKMCRICVKKGPEGAFEFVETQTHQINKDEWNGIAVYVDHVDGDIHPVTYELIGKAKEMAEKINYPVYCVFMGYGIKNKADELLHYGVDKVFIYDYDELESFRIEPYAAVFEDFINKHKPSIVLVGGTTIGRSLAPRVAARFRTGLTADCTILDIQNNTDLDQIRPAFGGNIMAHIYTPNHRPQFATVRYKIFDAPEKKEKKKGEIIYCDIFKDKLQSKITVLEIKKKKREVGIEEAEIIVVAGRAIKKEEDLKMIHELAELLGGQVAATRPLIESGWTNAKNQIGLSGRTVKPKLIITLGVSGAIQFVAGMNNSDCIISINSDKNAPIFNVAHYGIIGDIYEIIPKLVDRLKSKKINGEKNILTSVLEV